MRLWKGLLVALNEAFDRRARDLLLFLWYTAGQRLWYSGDGALQFAGLIAAGLVTLRSEPISVTKPSTDTSRFSLAAVYAGRDEIGLKISIELTDRGKLLVQAWLSGDEAVFRSALSTSPPSP